MGRTKGSKNKVAEKAEEIKKTIHEPVPAKPRPVGHSVAIVNDWKPTPSVEVKPGQRDLCHSCDHRNTMHYEGEKGHCNTTGCHCLEFK